MMKILLSILEILMILGIITNYKLLKKKRRKKRRMINQSFVYQTDRYEKILVSIFLKKKEVSGSFFFDIQSIDVMNIILMKV